MRDCLVQILKNLLSVLQLSTHNSPGVFELQLMVRSVRSRLFQPFQSQDRIANRFCSIKRPATTLPRYPGWYPIKYTSGTVEVKNTTQWLRPGYLNVTSQRSLRSFDYRSYNLLYAIVRLTVHILRTFTRNRTDSQLRYHLVLQGGKCEVWILVTRVQLQLAPALHSISLVPWPHTDNKYRILTSFTCSECFTRIADGLPHCDEIRTVHLMCAIRLISR